MKFIHKTWSNIGNYILPNQDTAIDTSHHQVSLNFHFHANKQLIYAVQMEIQIIGWSVNMIKGARIILFFCSNLIFWTYFEYLQDIFKGLISNLSFRKKDLTIPARDRINLCTTIADFLPFQTIRCEFSASFQLLFTNFLKMCLKWVFRFMLNLNWLISIPFIIGGLYPNFLALLIRMKKNILDPQITIPLNVFFAMNFALKHRIE